MISFIIAAAALAAATPQPAPPPVLVTPAAPPTSHAVDPAAVEAAREMLRSANFDQQVEETARRVGESTFKTVMDAQEREAGTTFPEGLKETIHALVRHNDEQLLAEMKGTMLDDVARVYATYFTADEIRELQRLQSNPVLAKAQRFAPQLFNDLMQIGMKRAMARTPELSRQIKAAVADWYSKHKPAAARRS